MAIAEPVLRSYVSSKWRIRGLNPLSIAIGAGIGIGTYLYENIEWTTPTGGNILTPPRGVAVGGSKLNNGSPQENASSYK